MAVKFVGILKRGKKNARLLVKDGEVYATALVLDELVDKFKAAGEVEGSYKLEPATTQQINFIEHQGRNLKRSRKEKAPYEPVKVKILAILNQGDNNDRILVQTDDGNYFTCLRNPGLNNASGQDIEVDKSGLAVARPEQISRGAGKRVKSLKKEVESFDSL